LTSENGVPDDVVRDRVGGPVDNIVDGSVAYRSDAHGARVALLPATCRRGHDLAAVGYRARESGGVLRMRCAACASAGVPDPYWTLRSTEPVANLAELDDGPYQHLAG
jgi:hypothetical protein